MYTSDGEAGSNPSRLDSRHFTSGLPTTRPELTGRDIRVPKDSRIGRFLAVTCASWRKRFAGEFQKAPPNAEVRFTYMFVDAMLSAML